MQEDNGSGIAYQASLAGRLARRVLPVVEKVLPRRWYQAFYDGLYSSYKAALRAGYLPRVFTASLTGSNEAAKARLVYQLLPFTMGGQKALENAFDVVALVEQRKIEGALVECGVAQGGTSAMMALASRELGTMTRQKWLFDSYEGLPDPTGDDYEGGKAGEFIRPLPKGACLGTVEQVEELMFGRLQLPREQVHLVKGWFQDTLPVHRAHVGPIAVLRLDGDWYESTKVPLENLFAQVVPGGCVIIDDYATCFGSRKAADEFRTAHNIVTPLRPDGRGGVWFEKASTSPAPLPA